jgi:hypothetical protein
LNSLRQLTPLAAPLLAALLFLRLAIRYGIDGFGK